MKKIISLLLAMIIALSVTAVAFAQDTKNYLILGDSIGWGAGVLNPSEAVFGKIVADTAGFNYKNDAINGYRTTDLIALLNEKRVANDVKDADIISISICGNDFLRNDIGQLVTDKREGNMERFDAISAESIKNFATIIETIKKINPNAVILCQTIYNPGKEEMKDVFQLATDRLNAGYRAYLDEHPGAYELLEVADAFVGHDEYVAMDNIHPSASGNIVIAKLVLQKLNSLGLTDATEPVINHEGINQSEFFSWKYFVYRLRNLFERIKAIFVR